MSEPVTTWSHRVPLPDSVTMTIPEEAPNRIIVYSETETDEPEPAEVSDAVRRQAWRAMGIPHNPDAALTKFARRNGLGAPLTMEFDFQHDGVVYRGQGYAMGVVYCEVDVWAPVWMVLW